MIADVLRFEDEITAMISSKSAPMIDLSGQCRKAAGVLSPTCRADVIRIVQAAKRHKVKLHPTSCGRNWGFGSTLPPEDGCWVIDLSKLNRIESYQAELGVARIEPGVTQIQLFQELARQGNKWFFNVTGAGHTTSVLGNALERGIGYHGQRQYDLLELDVVTGRGDLIFTRLGTDPKGAAPVGLDLTQLFVQNSFGVVVGARVRLLSRTDGGGVAIARLQDAIQTSVFFDTILGLKRDRVISGVPHLANHARIVSTMAPWLPKEEVEGFSQGAAPWTAALPILGCQEMTQAAFDVVRKRLSGFCEVETILSEVRLKSGAGLQNPMVQLQQLASGYPSNLALPGVEWAALGKCETNWPDSGMTKAGLIHVTPSIPSSAAEMEAALKLVQSLSQKIGLGQLPMTLNIIDQTFTALIISIGFPAADAVSFREKARALESSLQKAGLMPYRIGLGQEGWMSRPPESAQRLYYRLKAVFDPAEVLATSKYEVRYDALSRTPSFASKASKRRSQRTLEVA